MHRFEEEFKRPISEQQLAANRANALKSTGPRTEAGKARSALNASHRVLAQSIVLRCEDQDRFRAFVRKFHREFRPLTVTETSLVNTMASARWRLMRISHIESATVDLEYIVQIDPEVAPLDYGAADKAALAYRSTVRNSRVLDFVHRSEMRLQRQFDNALTNLLRLRARRGAMQPEGLYRGDEVELSETPEAELVP